MSIDVRIQPLAIDVTAPSKEARQAGVPAELQFSVVPGIALPFASDQNGTPIIVPLGNLRFALRKEDAVNVAKKILEEAENLPETSDIAIANDLRQAEVMAKTIGKARGE